MEVEFSTQISFLVKWKIGGPTLVNLIWESYDARKWIGLNTGNESPHLLYAALFLE